MSRPKSEQTNGWQHPSGYWMVHANGKEKMLHVLMAEKALGRPLRGTEEVHHFDRDKQGNRNENLVICPDRAYHMLLHVRQRAIDASGHAHWRKCGYCKKYDAPENLTILNTKGQMPRHQKCSSEYTAQRIAKLRSTK